MYSRGFLNTNFSTSSSLKIRSHIRFETALYLSMILNIILSKCLTFYFYLFHPFLQLQTVGINFLLCDCIILVQGLDTT